jgi:hypothetical protein
VARPLVIVKGVNDEDARALVRSWASALPELELEPVATDRALLKALEARRAAAVVVRRDESSPGSGEAIADVARRYPTTALLVLGSQPLHHSMPRAAPMLALSAEDHDSVLRFLREDVAKAARGSLSGVALPSVLQVLQLERRTCLMRVRSQRRTGMLVVRNGELIHAEYRKRAPLDAALELLAWTDADVQFEPAPTMSATIEAPIDFLLLESARRHDERRTTSAHGESVFPSGNASGHWSMQPLHKEQADGILGRVLAMVGAKAVAVVDIENRLLLGSRSAEDSGSPSVDRVSDIVRAVFETLVDMDVRDWLDEVVINLSARFMILRPFRAAPNLVLCATFGRREITLGLAKTMLAQAMDAEGVEPEVAR